MVKTNTKGFTLIELLIVIGIISILAGIVLVAVNPAVQFGKANDSERKSEIGTLLSAIYQYQTSPTARGALPQCQTSNGATPDTGPAVAIPECDTDSSGSVGNGAYEGARQLGTASGLYDCTAALIPNFLREIPFDPAATYSAATTGYFVCQHTTAGVSRVYVLAPHAEVYTTDGGCTTPGTLTPSMCVSG
jgi:type IV pilus assembly protein PilA